MREFKFRVWDKIANLLYSVENPYVLLKSVYIVMQYIGAIDLHGKDIYEGDIVMYRGIRYVVEFRNCGFQLIDKDDYICEEPYIDWYLCEVIGNIYETEAFPSV